MTPGALPDVLTAVACVLFGTAAVLPERPAPGPWRVRVLAFGAALLCVAALLPGGAVVHHH